MGWLAWKSFDEAARDQAALDASLAHSASALAQAVDAELDSSLQALKVLSQSGFFQQDRIGSLGRLLHGRPRRDWDSLVVIDRQGTVIIDTATTRTSVAETNRLRALHQEMLASKAPIVLRSRVAPSANMVTLAVPVIQDDQVRYVLGARMSDATWVFLAAAAQRPEGARAQIFDESGDPVVGIAPALAEGDGAHYSASDTTATARWKVRISLDANPVRKHRRAMLIERWTPLVVCLVAGLLLGLLTGWRAFRGKPGTG